MNAIKLTWKLIKATFVGGYRGLTSPIGAFLISITATLAVYLGVMLGWLAGAKYFVSTVILYFVTYTGLMLLWHFAKFIYNRYIKKQEVVGATK